MESIQPVFFRGPRSIFGREVESIEARLRNVEAQKLQYQKLFEDLGCFFLLIQIFLGNQRTAPKMMVFWGLPSRLLC